VNIDAPEQTVGIHVGSPLLQFMPRFAPDGNYIGLLLLYRLLDLALWADGLIEKGCCTVGGGNLNDSVFLVQVTDAVAAIQTIKRELGAVVLLNHCQIGVFEVAGWRCVFPSSQVRLNWLFDPERLEFAQSQQLNLLNEVLKQFEVLKQLARDEGEEGEKL
jgi:hypothetical protein